MSIDVEMERDVLATCIRDQDFVRKAVPVLKAYSFSSPQHTWLWEVISSTWEAHHELPSASVYRVRLERDFSDPDKRALAEHVLITLYERKPTAPKSALSEIQRFVRMSAVRAGLAEGYDALSKGDVDAAQAAIESGLLDARSVEALREPTCGTDTIERSRAYRGGGDRVFRFETPLDDINLVVRGGIPPGTLSIVTGQTNVGKSAWMVDVGFTALKRAPEIHVAHVTTEETEAEAFARYDARLTGFERSYLLAGRLTPTEAADFDRRVERAQGLLSRLWVSEYAPGTPSSMLWTFLDFVRGKAGPGVPILLLVDSADHLAPPAATNRKDHRLQVAAIYWSLKAMAKDRKIGPIAVWTVTWAPAEYERRRMTANATSETKEKGRIADFLLGASETDDDDAADDAERELTFDVLKNRLGRVKHIQITSSVNLGTCEFRSADAGSEPH